MTQCQNLIVIQGLIHIGLVIFYNDQNWWLNQGICGQVPKFTAALPKITPLLVIKSTTVRLDHEGHTIIFQTSETSTLGDVAEKTISRQSLEPQWNQSHYIEVSDESEPSWLEPELELQDFQLVSAWLVTFFPSARNRKSVENEPIF